MNNETEESKKPIRDVLEELVKGQQKLIEEKKAKKWKLPWKARVGKGKLKQGYVTVAYCNENNDVDFIKVPMQEGTTIIKEAPYLATSEYLMTHKGKPFMFINAACLEPYSPRQHLSEAEKSDMRQVGRRLLLNKMKMEAFKLKKPMPWGIILGGLAIIGIIWYVMSKGGLSALGFG